MKYLFILGRNPELSIKELESFFDKESLRYSETKRINNSFLVDFEKNLPSGVVGKLGGCVAIGEVRCELKDLKDTHIYTGSKNNFNYVVWDFSSQTETVSDYLKKRFRSEKLKATEKKLKDNLSLQNSDKAQSISSKLLDKQYFVFENYFGEIVEYSDYKEIEARDMKKPVRRESLSISPRLAKIMINLSKVKPKETLLDSFCGVGIILVEALNQGINVIGVDKDSEAIQGAKQNLDFFGFSDWDYKILNCDSTQVKLEHADAMVSEPDFGKTLKKIPTKEEADKMIKKFENLIVKVLNNSKKYVSGRLVFTAPHIRIGKKRIGCDFEKISSKTGLEVAEGFPIPEFRGNQIVGRHMVVLER